VLLWSRPFVSSHNFRSNSCKANESPRKQMQGKLLSFPFFYFLELGHFKGLRRIQTEIFSISQLALQVAFGANFQRAISTLYSCNHLIRTRRNIAYNSEFRNLLFSNFRTLMPSGEALSAATPA
jgi:hypothetical protein